MELLGILHLDYVEETNRTRGPYIRFVFLENAYTIHLQMGNWIYHARAYLLLLLGYNIFADKSTTCVPVKWLLLFQDYEDCGQWVWGPAALAFLYEQLNDGSYSKTSRCGGFATLLQVILIINPLSIKVYFYRI